MSYDPIYIHARVYVAQGLHVSYSKDARIQVRFDISPERLAGAQIEHVKLVAGHRANARAHLRESGGHLGAGALGNRMLYGWHATQDDAAAAALEQLRGLIESYGGEIQVPGSHPSIRCPDESAVDRLVATLEAQTPSVILR